MKKLSLLLAVVLMFSLTAIAQDSGQMGSSGSQSSATSSKKGMHKGGMNGKNATITGCVSKEANSDGMYTLTNGHFKKGVEIGPADKVQEHAGHQVKLTGKWASAAAAGETDAAATSGKEKGERHFEVADVTHISDTCSAASATTRHGKKGKKASSSPTGL